MLYNIENKEGKNNIELILLCQIKRKRLNINTKIQIIIYKLKV